MTLVLNGTSGVTFSDSTVLGTSPGSWQSVQTTSFTATAGNAYPVNTTAGAITVTLPASPTAGQQIVLTDYAGTWATYNVIVNPNGLKLTGISANGTLSTARGTCSLIYLDSTQGWVPNFNLVPSQLYSGYAVVVAGGGTGGAVTSVRGAGGGAGGLIAISAFPFTPGVAYTVTIGAGGASASGTSVSSGGNTTFVGNGRTLTALGGGTGGYNDNTNNATTGGSGGGQWYPGYTGAAATQPSNTNDGVTTWTATGFGYKGGDSGAAQPYGSGGGGAGGAGGNYNSGSGGYGGVGKVNPITGSTAGQNVSGVYYLAGGGSGAGYPGQGGYAEYAGGYGGGGVGSNDSFDPISNGTANTGGGGGSGGSGGSGIVIISYAGSQRATGGTVTSSGGNTIHTFTTSGTFTA